MKSLIDFIRDNPTGIVLVLVAAVWITGACLMQGCEWGDIYRVQVPTGIAVSENTPPTMTLREAELAMKSYSDRANANIQLLAERIDRGWKVGGMVLGAFNVGIPFLAATPIGAALVPLLTLGAGIMFKKPGTDRTVATEKQASYNKGLEKGQEAFRNALVAAGVKIPELPVQPPAEPA